MEKKLIGYLYLSLAMITVGSTVVASKIIASGLPPFTATALRFALALPVFLLLMRLSGQKLPTTPKRDWLILFIEAGAGSVGYTTLLISGLSLAHASDGGVIIGTLPVVAAAISVLVLGERPGWPLLLAIVLVTTGIGIITFDPTATNAGSLPGNLLILGAVFCEGIFILLNKRLSVTLPPLAQSMLMTGLGLVICLIPAAAEQAWTRPFSADAVLAVVYYALVPTVLGFLWWFAGAARVSGTEASLFTGIAPVTAVLMAGLLLGETISTGQVFGVVCVLAAVVVIAMRSVSRRPGS